MKMYSRRPMLFSVAGVEKDLSPASPSAQPFRLIHPQHDEFEPLMERHFAALKGHPAMPSLKRFSVLLHNAGTEHIRAYTIIWNYTDPAFPDEPQSLVTEFIQRHACAVTHNKNVPAGQVRLISPFLNVSSEQSRSGTVFVSPLLLRNEPLQRALDITSRVDGIVLKNHKFYGPDTTHLAKRYAVIRDAERDEALSVRYHSSKANPPWNAQALEALLESHLQEGKKPHSGYDEFWWQSRAIEAARLKRRLNDKGVKHLKHCVERRLRYKRVVLTKHI